MIVIDEHFPVSQRQLLKGWRIHFRQIGYEIGQKGLKDLEIYPVASTTTSLELLYLNSDFDDPKYCHLHQTITGYLFGHFWQYQFGHDQLSN